MAQAQEAGSAELIREVREALARCDVERLEEILVQCGRLAEGEITSTPLRVLNRAEFDVLSSLLEITKDNVNVVHRSRVCAGFHLEYQPFSTHTQDGAMS